MPLSVAVALVAFTNLYVAVDVVDSPKFVIGNEETFKSLISAGSCGSMPIALNCTLSLTSSAVIFSVALYLRPTFGVNSTTTVPLPLLTF